MRQALNFRHVEVIHAVVLTGSATGAAERLHVTQPAVSNMLRDAQERVGFELFTHKAGRLVPSASTLALFEEIERSFTGLGEINGLAQRLRRQRGRRVVLACTPVFGAVVLPRMLASLRASSPELMFTVHSRSAEHVAALVSSQKADLGFGLTVPPMPGVQSEVLTELPMVCYLPPGHRLARRRKAVTQQTRQLGVRHDTVMQQNDIGVDLVRLSAALERKPSGVAAAQHGKRCGLGMPWHAFLAQAPQHAKPLGEVSRRRQGRRQMMQCRPPVGCGRSLDQPPHIHTCVQKLASHEQQQRPGTRKHHASLRHQTAALHGDLCCAGIEDSR